ncbi:MAG: hypothetical protein Crog4KO_23350 [Crocinitomicaceae bacterium]
MKKDWQTVFWTLASFHEPVLHGKVVYGDPKGYMYVPTKDKILKDRFHKSIFTPFTFEDIDYITIRMNHKMGSLEFNKSITPDWLDRHDIAYSIDGDLIKIEGFIKVN